MEKKPGPWRITFDTNPDDCNLKCIMCEEHSIYSSCQSDRKKAGNPRRRMDIALLRKILEESKATPLREIIPSTMGEPLLYKYFDEIIELCKQYNVKMNLTTNGTFSFGRGATEWAKRIVPIGSDVKISWNGASKQTSELIMIGSNFEKRLQNVRDFISVREEIAANGGNFCRVTFQSTFIEIGLDELPDVIRLAASWELIESKDTIFGFLLLKWLIRSFRRSPEAIRKWNKIVEQALKVVETHRLPSGEKVLLENIYPLDETATENLLPDGICPFLGQEAWVSAEGRFNPCCAPDKDRRTLGDFGNLSEKSLEEIWTSPLYQNLQKNYLQYPICKRCNMRKKQKDLINNAP